MNAFVDPWSTSVAKQQASSSGNVNIDISDVWSRWGQQPHTFADHNLQLSGGVCSDAAHTAVSMEVGSQNKVGMLPAKAAEDEAHGEMSAMLRS